MAGTGGEARRATGAAVLLVSLALAGCTAEPSAPPESQPTSESVALRVRTLPVDGVPSLTPDARAEAESAVADVLTDYVVSAFLGDYPREDFVGSFESFTGDLAQKAARDLDQLTANRFGDAEAVRATRLDADLSFLVQDSDVIGATASVRFAFEVTVDGAEQPVSLRGRLMLVEEDDAWSVFGYDVRTNTGEAVEAEVTP